MPELPEVETVCRGLAQKLCGETLARVTCGKKKLRVPFPKNLSALAGCKITAIDRRAKYILIHLDDAQTLIIHLGMSGRMVLDPARAETHDHFILQMKSGAKAVLNDPRRFGLVGLCATAGLAQHKFFRHLGPEPFDKTFTAAYILQKFKNKKAAVKIAVMDQRLVVGVGNIYAAEALFLAGIDPRRVAGTLLPAEAKKLVAAIQKTLKKAIAAGGSTLRDYTQADGELGYFQHSFAVYGRTGKKCRGCVCKGKNAVEQLTQGGRSTFYCPVLQK